MLLFNLVVDRVFGLIVVLFVRFDAGFAVVVDILSVLLNFVVDRVFGLTVALFVLTVLDG